jgi:excisionase family DNA binding protein
MELQPLYTVNTLAEYMGVSRDLIYRLVASGQLKPGRVGNRLRFHPDEVERYIARNTAQYERIAQLRAKREP